jgi:hypothetical protein
MPAFIAAMPPELQIRLRIKHEELAKELYVPKVRLDNLCLEVEMKNADLAKLAAGTQLVNRPEVKKTPPVAAGVDNTDKSWSGGLKSQTNIGSELAGVFLSQKDQNAIISK